MAARTKVASLTELKKATKKRVIVSDVAILLVFLDGVLYAIEDTCTHAGSSLYHGEIEDTCVTCPHHGAQFDIRSGKAMTLPAYIDLKTFIVTSKGDDVYIEL